MVKDDVYCQGCFDAWSLSLYSNKLEHCAICGKPHTEDSGKNSVGWYTWHFIIKYNEEEDKEDLPPWS